MVIISSNAYGQEAEKKVLITNAKIFDGSEKLVEGKDVLVQDNKIVQIGRCAQEFIQAKIIEIAKNNIFDPDKSISEIAFDLCFKQPQHFTPMFKKSVGMSPSDYRRLN